MAPRVLRAATSPARSRTRSPPPPQKAPSLRVRTPSVSSPTAVVEVLGAAESHVLLPIRFQCPLCFDVLRAPIQLPCCARHLCRECFERALELTSVNCGFCRKRLVGFARKKQYAVDDALWTEIQRCCPFVAHADGDSDAVVDVEFVDENAKLGRRAELEQAPRVPEPVDVVVEEPSRDHEDHDVQAIENDEPTHVRVVAKKRAAPSDSRTKMQRQLEAFFAGTLPSPNKPGSRPSSAGSVRSLRSTTSSNSSSGSSTKSGVRAHRRFDLVGKKKALQGPRAKPMLRSTSHSPKHRAPHTVQRTLLQLTLHSPGGPTTRQSASASLVPNLISTKVTMRPRRPWRCRHCTYENTCFDTCCSMCHQYPANVPMPS